MAKMDTIERQQADELQALIGENRITLGSGEEIDLHEYSFMEGLRVDNLATLLIRELQDLFLDGEIPQEEIRLQDLAKLFGYYQEIMPELLAISANRSAEWVRGLSDQDGQLLLMAWWSVNRDFFVRRLVAEAGARMALHQAGVGSSPV